MPSNYTKADLDAMLEDYEHDKFDNTRPWQAQSGTNNIRILPAHENANGRFLVKGGRHWGVAEYPVHCAVSFKIGDTCWACEKAAALQTSSSKADKAEGKRMQAQPIWLSNIVDLDHTNLGIQVAEFGRQIYKDLIKFVGDEDFGDISDLDEGYNVIIEKEGGGRTDRTNYTARCRKRQSAAPEEIRELVEDGGLRDLVEYARILEDDELEDLYEGNSSNEDEADDDDDDEIPAARSRAKTPKAAAKKTAKVQVVDDDDDEDDDVEEDEDEEEDDLPIEPPAKEEEAPRRRTPGRPIPSGSTGAKLDEVLGRHGRSK